MSDTATSVLSTYSPLSVLEVHSGQLCVLTEEGDTRFQWSKHDPEQVSAARAKFKEYKRQGYSAYRLDASGQQGEVLQEFDPAAERIILAPRFMGG